MDTVDDADVGATWGLPGLPEVVYLILKHLPMKDLHRVARVNSLWNETVKQIKKSRRQISWCFYSDMENGGVDVQIGRVLEVLASEPRFAFMFCSSSLFESTVSIPSKSSGRQVGRCYPRAAKQEKISFACFLERILPPSCRLAGVCTDGVVGTNFRSDRIQEMESSTSASCLFLPKLEGTEIFTCALGNECSDLLTTLQQSSADEDAHARPLPSSGLEDTNLPDLSDDRDSSVSAQVPTRDELKRPLVGENSEMSSTTKECLETVTSIPSDRHPKLILLFITDPDYPFDQNLGETILERYEGVVIAGGYTDNVIFEKSLNASCDSCDDPAGMAVAFCGEGISVASIVLPSHINDEKDIEAELARLRSAHVSADGRSVAFMFACVGRGQGFYGGRENVESRLFRKFFPHVPLLGFFGNGEIGFNHLPGDLTPEKVGSDGSGSNARPHPIFHSYTTILVLVSFL